MERRNFFSKLRALYWKLIWEAFLKRLILCAAVAMGIAFLLTAAAKWMYLDLQFFYGCLAIAVVIMPIGLTVLWDRITYQKVAAAGDALGLSERLITAYELLEKKDRVAVEELAVADAMAHLNRENLAKKYRLSIPKKWFLLFVLLTLATVICGFTEGPQDRMSEEMKKTLLQVEEIQKELGKDPKLEKKDLREVDAIVQELKKGIAKSTTEAEALKEIDQAQQTLKKLEKKSVAKELQTLGEKLAAFSQELGQAMQTGDVEAIQQGMEALLDKIGEMSEEEREALKKALQEAAKEGTNGALSQALENLAKQAGAGAIDAKTAEELLSKLKQLAQENASLRAGLQTMNQALAKTEGQQRQQGQAEQEGQGQQGQAGQQGQGQQGQAGQQGQGQQGQAGQGQQGQGLGQNGGSGRGLSPGESESIYTREAQGQTGYGTQISGAQNDSGDSSVSAGRTQGQAGESVPYESVVQEYKDAALQDISNGAVPYGMKQLVEDYFSTLEK